MRADRLRRLQKLLLTLADGQFHSGESLAVSLGVSRTTIWKLITQLQSWQITIYAVRGKGYKIPKGLHLIDAALLKNVIESKAQLFSQVDVLPTVDSTSDYLARCWQADSTVGRICVAEHQTHGRGRKGRRWVSPFGANLYFSLGLNMPLGLSALGGLSLAVGIGLTKFLNQYTTKKISLKWPNDLLVDDQKLAGILVEASGDSNDSSFLNIGVGLNWDMKNDGATKQQQRETKNQSAETIEQPWINLKPLLSSHISRSQFLLRLLVELDQVLHFYLEQGFEPFRQQWPSFSAYYGQKIVLNTHHGKVTGIEQGIDKSGAIKIKTCHGEKSFFSGEVSIRAFV